MDPRYHNKQPTPFIDDNFSTLDEVINALREAGLESSNLILGIDFTQSNEWNGKRSFNRKSLHAIGAIPNPYEQAISIIGRTLSPFDEDNLIPCFGFGDASTSDNYVFSFYADHRPCNGFSEVLVRYRDMIPHIKLSGPTSFAPIINAGIDIVEKNNGQYHVLVIIADGQVTRNPSMPPGQLSPQEKGTVDAIVTARWVYNPSPPVQAQIFFVLTHVTCIKMYRSQYPLSIILVGVGDGPWDAMKQFDDMIPHRVFDNFQFVNFSKIMSENKEEHKKEAAFALAALMEIPFQYRATQRLHISKLDLVGGVRPKPLPPPPRIVQHEHDNAKPTKMESFSDKPGQALTSGPSQEQVCPICFTNPKDMAFGCGHTTCKACGPTLSHCPVCHQPITTRVRLFS
ncbi:hypothetical protein QQ045_015946 [Rhodiola kirilowii]